VQELKHAIAEKTDAPADRQRLIYSGKVLKARLPSYLSPQYTITNLKTPSLIYRPLIGRGTVIKLQDPIRAHHPYGEERRKVRRKLFNI